MIDVGYAGVIGADRIVDGDQLYGEGFSDDVERGDTYGPVNYLLYVPFEQALPWSGRWDDLPAAHGAAIGFDLLAIGGLLLLGRLRAGPRGHRPRGGARLRLGGVSVHGVRARVELERLARGAGLRGRAARRHDGAARASPGPAAMAIALGAAAKFVPLALAPLFARRAPLGFGAALLLVLAAVVLPFVPDGGLRELYDRTVGYQASGPRRSASGARWSRSTGSSSSSRSAAAGLALLVAFVPRRLDLAAVAALGAAVLIAVQLTATHWFYLYVVWFVPFVLVALFARTGGCPSARGARAEERSARLVPA